VQSLTSEHLHHCNFQNRGVLQCVAVCIAMCVAAAYFRAPASLLIFRIVVCCSVSQCVLPCVVLSLTSEHMHH